MECVTGPLMAIEAAIREGTKEGSSMTSKTLQALKTAHKQLTEQGGYLKVAAEDGWAVAKKVREMEGKTTNKNVEKAKAEIAKAKAKEKPSAYTTSSRGRGCGRGGSGRGGGRSCFICEKDDHLARYCPMKKQLTEKKKDSP